MIPAETQSTEASHDQSPRRKAIAFWFLIGIAIALRVLALNETLFIDEAGSIAIASAADFGTSVRQDVHPPLYYALLRLELKFTSSFAVLRLASVAFGVALVAVAMWATRRSFAAMLVAGLATTALPALVLHSRQLRPYALLFLLLAIALTMAVQIFDGSSGTGSKFVLAGSLLLAAATHLVTAFFLLALAPLLLWPVRRNWRQWVLAWLPLCPAGLLLLGLKFAFVAQPGQLAEGWWLPAVSYRVVVNGLRDAGGWDDIWWFADACARRMSWSGPAVLWVSIAALLLAVWSAWGRRGAPLTWALLASALVYTATLIAYSVFFEPIVMGRTLLPGVLVFVAGLAWGIGTDPVRWRRTAAIAALAVYASIATAPGVRRAFSPIAGLRGLATAAQEKYQAGDLVVLLRSMDFGLAPYWRDFSGSDPLRFDQTQSTGPQFSELRRRLDNSRKDARVLLAYREDFYLEQHRDVLNGILRELAAHGRPSRIFWHENDFTLLLAEPTAER